LKLFKNLIFLFLLASPLYGEPTIVEFVTEGNLRVESDAIFSALSLKKGEVPSAQAVAKDIKALFNLGYFSDIRFYKVESNNGLQIKIKVVEKPSITNIRFEGLEELKEEDFKNVLETKQHTIIKEKDIASDVRKIEKKYAEKGFYLAKVDYVLEEKNKNEVELIFRIDEKSKVLVGDVTINGNNAFPSSELIENLATKPCVRSLTGIVGSAACLFQQDYLNRDVEYLSFHYKDNGFANVKVAKPATVMDEDQKFVRVHLQIEEGLQYNIGNLSVSEDGVETLLSEKDLVEAMLLKQGKLFRYSKFAKDIETLMDKYGDLGYAYADVNPKTVFNDENKTVDIHYEITKGEKVFFGQILITGNTKTRDNVIRREFSIHESELFSGTKLTKSKAHINRLGYFEEVQVLKERQEDKEDLVNIRIKVKEKSTGQVQASLAYSPSGQTKQSWSGQGRYEEKNQSGRGWITSFFGRYATNQDWDLELGFTDPKVYDSAWSFGTTVSERRLVRLYTSEIEIPESQSSIGVTIGRDIIELIRASVTLRHTYTKQLKDVFTYEDFKTGGVKNTVVLGLSRKDLDNNLDPTQGNWVSLSHSVNGGPLKGDLQFMETLLDAWYYYPVDFSETYRTHFRLRGVMGKLWSFREQEIPPSERYRLGGYENLRGYAFGTVGPRQRRLKSPLNGYNDYYFGGDKEIFFQFEYLVPLIPKAGIKAVFFADGGRSFEEDESYALKDFKKDVGFGFRWVTPIAPFRFEWAYPYIDKKQALGDLQFIFTLGY
jgi:outer membrane protein insertion porin family